MARTSHDLVVEAESQIKEVSTVEGRALMTRPTIIDLREYDEYDEYAAGHLPGAINIPRGVRELKIGIVGECADKAKPYLIYCRTSGRAALSTVQLQRTGYADVISMAGGFKVWNTKVCPTEKPEPVNFEQR